MRVIPSNLHSCNNVIQSFRANISSDQYIPFADIMFPEEKLSCILGREIKFLLAVDKSGGAGCCILASSTEPLRTEILFMHALRDETDVLKTLLGNVLSFLNSRRAPDVETKFVEDLHSASFRNILNYYDFTEMRKVRLLMRAKEVKKASKSREITFRVRSTDSLLNWRTVFLNANTELSIEESRKQVYSETPIGTIQEDDLTRLIGYDGKSAVGTIGYSICRTIGYLDKLSVLTSYSNRNAMTKKLVMGAIRRLVRKRCEYVVIDVDESKMPIDMLKEIGFCSVGHVEYFSKTITSKIRAESKTKGGSSP